MRHEHRQTAKFIQTSVSFPNEGICNRELTNINEEMIHKPNIWKQDNNSKICEVIPKPLFGKKYYLFPNSTLFTRCK